MVPWCLLLWLWDALEAAGFQVEMAGRTQIVFLNDNITITCKIPGSPTLDISTVGVVWFVRKKEQRRKFLCLSIMEITRRHTELEPTSLRRS